jgi:hypothetical protein
MYIQCPCVHLSERRGEVAQTLVSKKEAVMSGPFEHIPRITHAIPLGCAYEAVSRGVSLLERETNPEVRRRLKFLIAQAKEPSSLGSVSAVETLMRWGKR